MKASIGTDLVASVVVFLVALPLCIGVAAASGVPVALGIISGIIGGLVVGFLPGSSLQVSGPAAGLAVLVLEFVTEHGVGLLGPVVLVSGLLQMALGALRAGRIFQSISVSVVQGMLAGIGVPLILSQTYAMVDSKQLGTALKNIAGLPDLAAAVAGDAHKAAALVLGLMALVLCFAWKKVPEPLGKVPAPLIAVMLGCVIGAMPGFEVKKVSFGNMLDAVTFVTPSALGHLLDPALLTMIVTFTVIASAESLFSAAAVDRMHTGPRTKYNAELFSQGVGNTIAGLLGALPLTAVIVRSAANVQAGAKTKISRILHGAWLLGFGLLLPGLLGLIPVSVLAGVLLHAGWKLFNPPAFKQMWQTDRGEGIVMLITTGAIVVANLLEGVLAGLAVAIVLVALRMSRMTIKRTTTDDTGRIELKGNATFLRLPKLIDALGSIADKPRVHVDASGLSHLDLACRSQIEEWAEQRRKSGALHVDVRLPEERGSGTKGAGEEREPVGVEERGPVVAEERGPVVAEVVADTLETEVTEVRATVRAGAERGGRGGLSGLDGLGGSGGREAEGLVRPFAATGAGAAPPVPGGVGLAAGGQAAGGQGQGHPMGQGFAHGQPVHAGQPMQSGQPSHTGQPAHPSYPSHPVHPVHPVHLGHVAHPVHPGQPVHGVPAQGHPGHQHGAGHAGHPGHGGQPVHGAHPGHGGHPGHLPHPAQAHPGQAHPGQAHQPHPGHPHPASPPQQPWTGPTPDPYGPYAQPGQGTGYWGPEDEWAAQQYGEGTRR
ncbi:SulP family inorganic anion transporter [Streptomyces sp. NPDC093252]|uniref:SulP family inorganic anion transporter n=1 Tax=Streptomyces sp. NPDC093252 TaxID=3154980 RepID=UPI00343B3CB1